MELNASNSERIPQCTLRSSQSAVSASPAARDRRGAQKQPSRAVFCSEERAERTLARNDASLLNLMHHPNWQTVWWCILLKRDASPKTYNIFGDASWPNLMHHQKLTNFWWCIKFSHDASFRVSVSRFIKSVAVAKPSPKTPSSPKREAPHPRQNNRVWD